MHIRRPMRLLLGALFTGFVAASAAVALPAQAAEQSTIENPPVAGDGVCPDAGGVIGQSFTMQESAALASYSFWISPGDTPSGATLSATVSVGWWIQGGLRPFVEQDVSFTVPAESTLTTLTPLSPIPLVPNTMFAVVLDFHGVNACPVTFAPGADYAGGFMVLGAQQAEGDLAFEFGLSPVDEQPGPYIPPGFIGSPPPGTVGAPYSYQFRLVGSNNPVIDGQTLSVPGLTLDGAGLLSGTPTQAGTFVSQVSATDGTITNTRDVIITIAQAPPPGASPPVASPGAPAAPAPPATARVPSASSAHTIPATGAELMPSLALAASAMVAGGAVAVGAALARRLGARRDPG